MGRRLAAFAAAVLVAVAQAVAAQTFAVARTSHTLLLADDAHAAPHLCNYAAYRITADAPVTDLWATIGNFAGGRIALAATEDGVYHVGAIPAAAYGMAYFYLCGDTVPDVGELVPGQTHTLTLWDRDPTLPGAVSLDATNWSLTYAHAHINANANKIDAVTVDPPDPVVGSTFTIRVDGRTGTVGSDEHLVFTAAAHVNWPAGAFELRSAYIDLPDAGGDPHILVDELVHAGLDVNSADTPYFAIYTFRVVAPTTAATQTTPYAFIDSGQNLKHVNVSHVVYPDIPPSPSPATLVKAASPTVLTQQATAAPAFDVTFTVTINNSDDLPIALDELRDVLPASFTYTPGSATFGGSAIADPLVLSSTLVWTGSFAIPAQSTRALVFHATLPGNAATGPYLDCATARIGLTQIDTTADTTDDAPACATVTVIPTPPPATGTIVVTKATVGGGGSFSFTATPAPPLSNFAIDASGGSGVQTFTGLGAGNYVITETVPAGWSLTAIACTISPSTAGSYTPDLANARVTITLGSGTVQASCQFTDTRLGSITVVKDATPSAGQSFGFQTTGLGAPFALAPPGTTQQAFPNLAAGNYAVTELVPAGWTLGSIECSITRAGSNTTTIAYTGAPGGAAAFQPGDTTASIALGAGDDVRCVFEDLANGSITIVKNAIGGNGAFAFDTDGAPGTAEVVIATSGGVGQAVAFASAPPGVYAIRELAPGDWRLTSIQCVGALGSDIAYVGSGAAAATQDAFDAGDHTAEIMLAPGDAVTCTYTNTAVVQVPVPALSDAMLVALALILLGAGLARSRLRGA